MSDPHANEALGELIARGHIVASPAPEPLARGNVDRLEATARSSWLVTLPTGRKAKLALGRDLSDLAARHAQLADACPTVVPALLAHVRLPSCDAVLESFVAGPTLELAAAQSLLPPAVIRQAVNKIRDALAATEQPSSAPTRAAEWNAWTSRLLGLPVWQPAEARSLEHDLLPALWQRLTVNPPVTRWSNGDLLPANILLNADGDAHLIDAEFASRTHFFAEDAVRFHAFSPAVQDHPDLFAGLLPEPDLSWHLYFWLRQFQLETEHNTPAYLARVQPVRLGLIRRLAENALGLQLSGWRAPGLPVAHSLEDIYWLFGGRRAAVISGWCHVPAASRLHAVVALGRTGRLASVSPAPRADVQAHFGGEPRALLSGFALSLNPEPAEFPLTLCAVIDNGTVVPFDTLDAGDFPRGAMLADDYPVWAMQFDPDPAQPAAAGSETGLLLSVLLPVYKTPEAFLRTCLDSMLAQHYPHWELCVVDDGSKQPDLTAMIERQAATDPRIRFLARGENGGIARATNDALAMARGEFVVLLDHDDVLRPHALAGFASRLASEPTLDALYSDEDKITADGQRLIPFLKPDYSPEFLLGVMYIGHALCVRTSIARATGGFDPAFDGIQDYEFFLRVTEHTSRIGHIPRMLYHWRQSPDSSALHGNIKGDMDQRQAAAVQAHLTRRRDPRTARAMGGHRVRLENPATPTWELVRSKDQASALATLRQAATSSAADVLVLLSIETRDPRPDCLDTLAALAARPDSACVAPLLLSTEGRVYESGNSGGSALMRGFHAESDGYHGSLRCNREVDAVSPVCVALRRAILLAAPVGPGDDWSAFIARLRAQGLYHRVCASARMQVTASCHEATRPAAITSPAREFLNPHFDAQKGDYTLATDALPYAQVRPQPQFHIDQPGGWDSLNRCLIIRGWCYSRPGLPVAAIRLRSGGLTLSGSIGLSRPDVKLARADAPDEFTGFEIRGKLPGGRQQIQLEAQLADGHWCSLLTRNVTVQRKILPLWLGGGDSQELMFFQMPAHMAHPPRALRPENFPAPSPAPKPKLSIVTPSYNQARFLPETMRSILEQTGVNCEYVVQDGGSTDGSVEYIKSQASRLHAWTSGRDAGQADAIARGFARTSGAPEDIMAWINSDDFYLPGALAHVADYFARHPDLDVLYGHRVVVNEESQEIARWFLPRHDAEVLRLNDFVPQETLFWRRRIWDQVGGIDPSFKFAMDWDLLLRFQAAGGRIVRVPRFLACFRVHSAQKTAARMHDIGQQEITLLRERTYGRHFPPSELEQHPRLLRYLRRSARIELLWRLGLRAP